MRMMTIERTGASLSNGPAAPVATAPMRTASQHPSTVVYDRAHSAISELTPGSIPWHDVFEGAAAEVGAGESAAPEAAALPKGGEAAGAPAKPEPSLQRARPE